MIVRKKSGSCQWDSPISIYFYCADNMLLPVRMGSSGVEGEDERRVIGQSAR